MSGAFEQALRRQGAPVFAPLAFRLAARLEQASWDELVEEPALTAHAVRTAIPLLGLDAVFAWLDPWIEAEAAGRRVSRSGDGAVTQAGAPLSAPADAEVFAAHATVRAAVDVAARLAAERPGKALILGAISGPATLLDRLYGTAAIDRARAEAGVALSLRLARGFAEAGVDALVAIEDASDVDPDRLSAFAPVFNLAAYYNRPIVLLGARPLPDAYCEAARQAGARLVAAPGLGGEALVAPVEAFAEGAIGPAPSETRIVFSAGELPPDTPAEAVLAAARALKGIPAAG